jgi:uncharacterized protein with PIN domain
VIVLDAYALIALLADEPAAGEVGELMSGGETVVPTPNLAEAVDRLARVHGVEVERTRIVIEGLQQSARLSLRPVTGEMAWRAARLRAEHYHPMGRPLSLGDCLLLAAVSEEERLASSDAHLLAVAHAAGIWWIDLPDSHGERHPPSRGERRPPAV